MNRKEHWETVYNTRDLTELSWYQPTPEISLEFMKDLGIPREAVIIDAGGGDGLFADHLLSLGYRNITVLDISETAISRAKKRLGSRASLINWVVSDITAYVPDRKFDLWHDRAAFHFLTSEEQINSYLDIVNSVISEEGRLVIGTFSESGPTKCSGLPVKQYSEITLTERIKQWFTKIKCIQTDHVTPRNTVQNFLFCSFKKNKT